MSQEHRPIRERISDKEHQQWMSLTKYYANEEDEIQVSEEKLEYWKSLWVPYEELSEEDKDKDRKYADKVLDEFETVSDDAAWIIIEGLMESYYGLKDMEEEELAERTAKLLDKLSPNWRDADSCKEVKTKDIFIDGG